MKLILGSSSKWRKEILENLGFQFEVISPNIDEKSIRHTDPHELTLAIANAKATAILAKIQTPSIIITSDQVVTWKNEIREKPLNEKEARYFLESIHLAPSATVTAVVVTNTLTQKRFSGIDVARIWFKALPEKSSKLS